MKGYAEEGFRVLGNPAYDDESYAATGSRISTIRIWHSTDIEGIEPFYGGISAEAKVGVASNPMTRVDDFILLPNEEIVEIQGRKGAHIHQLAFITNTGRAQTFGTSMEGDPFSLKCQGGAVWYLKYGVAAYLEFIGAVFVDSVYVPGPLPGPMPGPFPPVPVPAPMPEPIPGPMPGPMPGPIPGPGGVFPTQTVGGDNDKESSMFDDYVDKVAPMMANGWISNFEKITIWYGYNIVEGIEIKYRFDSYMGAAPQTCELKHIGKSKDFFSHHETIQFLPGENIIGIRGRSGALIDRLEILTDQRGIVIGAGGSGGSEFVLNIPPGKRVVAFAGATVKQLRNLFAYWA